MKPQTMMALAWTFKRKLLNSQPAPHPPPPPFLRSSSAARSKTRSKNNLCRDSRPLVRLLLFSLSAKLAYTDCVNTPPIACTPRRASFYLYSPAARHRLTIKITCNSARQLIHSGPYLWNNSGTCFSSSHGAPLN